MRFYGFGNYYLSSLQQGLQSAHVVGDLLTSFKSTSMAHETAYNWAKNHKTMVLLNGGNAAQLQAIYKKFKKLKKMGMTLPFVKFHEDAQSLGGALTYVGIVVPKRYYKAGAKTRPMSLEEKTNYFQKKKFSPWEIELVKEIGSYPLAH